MLPFLAHKLFTFYINDVLQFKCPAPGSKGQSASTKTAGTEHCCFANARCCLLSRHRNTEHGTRNTEHCATGFWQRIN